MIYLFTLHALLLLHSRTLAVFAAQIILFSLAAAYAYSRGLQRWC